MSMTSMSGAYTSPRFSKDPKSALIPPSMPQHQKPNASNIEYKASVMHRQILLYPNMTNPKVVKIKIEEKRHFKIPLPAFSSIVTDIKLHSIMTTAVQRSNPVPKTHPHPSP